MQTRSKDKDIYNYHVSAFNAYKKTLSLSKNEQRLDLLLDGAKTYIVESYLLDENFTAGFLENYHKFFMDFLSDDTVSPQRGDIISYILDRVSGFRFTQTKKSERIERDAFYLSNYRTLRLLVLLHKKLTLEQSKKLLAIVVDYITHIYIQAKSNFRFEQYKNTAFELLNDLSNFYSSKDFHDKVVDTLRRILSRVDKDLLKTTDFYIELNFPKQVFLLACTKYPGICIDSEAPVIDTVLAFDLYSSIPAWADEYGPAQFWMGMLVCYHSNFTPELFSEESIVDKYARILEMKKYIDSAAETGFEEAVIQKIQLEQELTLARETRRCGNVSITAHPAFFANKPNFKKVSHHLILPIEIKFK